MVVIVPAEVQMSTYVWNLESKSKNAYVFKGSDFQILKTVYDVQGDPPTAEDYPDGPNSWLNRYGDRRKFFKVGTNKYVWQDKTTKGGKITTFSGNEATTIDVAIDTGFILAAATNGDAGKIYYISIQDGNNPDKVTTRIAYLIHANEDGSTILKKSLDTTSWGINIWELAESCLLTYGGTIL